jgi:hypothetical protein
MPIFLPLHFMLHYFRLVIFSFDGLGRVAWALLWPKPHFKKNSKKNEGMTSDCPFLSLIALE